MTASKPPPAGPFRVGALAINEVMWERVARGPMARRNIESGTAIGIEKWPSEQPARRDLLLAALGLEVGFLARIARVGGQLSRWCARTPPSRTSSKPAPS